MANHRSKAAILKRFMASVSIRENGCWVWIGQVGNWGYGKFFAKGKHETAHRMSYKLFRGKIPNGKQIDHLCRNKLCVNPSHLEAVSIRENVLRGIGLAAQNAQKTHCNNGHELSGSNLYICPRGKRECRRCRAQASMKFAHKKRSLEQAIG